MTSARTRHPTGTCAASPRITSRSTARSSVPRPPTAWRAPSSPRSCAWPAISACRRWRSRSSRIRSCRPCARSASTSRRDFWWAGRSRSPGTVSRPRSTRRGALPLGVRQLAEDLLQRETPARADHLEVLVVEIDADVGREPKFVAPYDGEIQGRADGEIRADGRVHGDERALGGLCETARARDHAVDDGLAVFRLADLKVRRLARGLDEVARRVDVKEPRLLAANLTPQDEGAVELVAVLL